MNKKGPLHFFQDMCPFSEWEAAHWEGLRRGTCPPTGWKLGLGRDCLPAVNSAGPQFPCPENGNDNAHPVYQCGRQSEGPPEGLSDGSRERVTASASSGKGTVHM